MVVAEVSTCVAVASARASASTLDSSLVSLAAFTLPSPSRHLYSTLSCVDFFGGISGFSLGSPRSAQVVVEWQQRPSKAGFTLCGKVKIMHPPSISPFGPICRLSTILCALGY